VKTSHLRVLLVFTLFLVLGILLSAQRRPDQLARSLWLYTEKEAWVITDWLPGSWTVCAAFEAGELRGCVTVASLREQAAREKKGQKK
jgi:hypothetical protein